MGTSFFPQVLDAFPVTTARFSPCRLRFSASVSYPFAFRESSVSVLRASLSFGNSCDSTRTFTLQAASGSEEAVSDVASGNEELPEEPETEEIETEGALESVEKPARKPRIKLGDIMGILNKRAIEASDNQRQTPDIRVGDVVQIKLEVPENRRRLSVYKGIVMSKQNAGIHTTIRIRRIIAGIGVEIVFPIYSPNIKEIRVMSHRKVRRARLYYLRDKLPRLSTFK